MGKKWVLITAFISGSILFLLLPILSSPDFSTDFSFLNVGPFQQDFLTYLLILLFFYVHYYFIIPRWYFTRKWVVYAISLIVCYSIIQLVPDLLIEVHIPLPGMPPEMMQKGGPPNHFPWMMKQHFVLFFTVVLFSVMLRIYSRWKEIEREKSEIELRYLKAQINPHFLFNTLNVIYASSIEEKARKTTNQLQLLSDMLRYVLTDSHKEMVTVQDEMKYIRSYISLQDERNAIHTEATIDISDDYERAAIPPLLLIPLIENAYKYGINPAEKSGIRMFIAVADDQIICKVENTITNIQHHTDTQHGIGLSNTLQRLNHLFPGRYLYKVSRTEKMYSVELQFPVRK